MSRRLIAIDLAGGPAFVDALRSIWDDGDAALPVDQRLPETGKASLYRTLRPHQILSTAGRRDWLPDSADPASRSAERSAAQPAGPAEVGTDDAIVVATSGTTGTPKGVVLTHAAIAASSAATSARLGVTGDDHWLACLPLSHVGGLSVVLRALWAHTDLTVLPRFDVDTATAAAHDGANLVSLVPTALGRIDATLFDTIVLGGARPPTDRPANTVTTYGMTETGSGVVYDRVPLDGVELRIVDDEVQVRCPMLLRCYRGGEPFEINPLDPDGWFATGDLGSIDADGKLMVSGRRAELIITGGENVWPGPVEEAIAALDSVAEVVVAGTDDPEWGQIVTAHVVPNPGAAVTLDAIRDAVKGVLPAFSAPRRLVLRESIPKTALGKPQRTLL